MATANVSDVQYKHYKTSINFDIFTQSVFFSLTFLPEGHTIWFASPPGFGLASYLSLVGLDKELFSCQHKTLCFSLAGVQRVNVGMVGLELLGVEAAGLHSFPYYLEKERVLKAIHKLPFEGDIKRLKGKKSKGMYRLGLAIIVSFTL